MVAGSSLYVLYQIQVVPPALRPLFSSPAVYGTTLVLAGIVWLVALRTGAEYRVLAAGGMLAIVPPAAVALAVGAANGTLSPAWPLAGVVISTVLGAAAWIGFRQLKPEDARTMGVAGALVLFAHALDGVSTAIGVDVLNFGEKTPLSRFVLEIAGALPTAPVIGTGWLFVVVKLAVAGLVLWFLGDMVRDDPQFGNALVLVVIAVGLGPGAHNILLFTVLGAAGI
jgi:uncharacterized membrane protein